MIHTRSCRVGLREAVRRSCPKARRAADRPHSTTDRGRDGAFVYFDSRDAAFREGFSEHEGEHAASAVQIGDARTRRGSGEFAYNTAQLGATFVIYLEERRRRYGECYAAHGDRKLANSPYVREYRAGQGRLAVRGIYGYDFGKAVGKRCGEPFDPVGLGACACRT